VDGNRNGKVIRKTYIVEEETIPLFEINRPRLVQYRR
jgi:hypothetical protein